MQKDTQAIQVDLTDVLLTEDKGTIITIVSEECVTPISATNKIITNRELDDKEDSLGIPNIDGEVLSSDIAGNRSWITIPQTGGQVNQIIPGSGIEVNAGDPVNPIVSAQVTQNILDTGLDTKYDKAGGTIIGEVIIEDNSGNEIAHFNGIDSKINGNIKLDYIGSDVTFGLSATVNQDFNVEGQITSGASIKAGVGISGSSLLGFTNTTGSGIDLPAIFWNNTDSEIQIDDNNGINQTVWHAGNLGTNGLLDVNSSGAVDGQVLTWVDGNGLWEPANLPVAADPGDSTATDIDQLRDDYNNLLANLRTAGLIV